MTEQFQSIAQHVAQERISASGVDITGLSPRQIVNLYALAAGHEETVDIGTPWEDDTYGLRERLSITLELLPEAHPDRAREIFRAFADSPDSEDRETLTNYLVISLTKVDHDAGVALWDRLIRDVNRGVRDAAVWQLDVMLSAATDTPNEQDPSTGRWLRGMHFVARLDEARLSEFAGLTRQDAHSLLESYAYAENGQYVYDLGREALRKLIAVQTSHAQLGPEGP